MKLVILAGGLGSRISEETYDKPKPLIEIGGKPIIWHIMKYYEKFGFDEFIICCGYKGYKIKQFFRDYYTNNSDLIIDTSTNKVESITKPKEKWKIHLIDTGSETMTGGRIKRVEKFLKNDEFFCLTYGDGLSNVNIDSLLKFHKRHKKLATLSSFNSSGRFGILDVKKDRVLSFKEKPNDFINIGFFVLSPEVINFIKNDSTIWEKEPMSLLAKNNNLMAFNHKGFFHPMDTLRDKIYLEDLWKRNKAPWKVWN